MSTGAWPHGQDQDFRAVVEQTSRALALFLGLVFLTLIRHVSSWEVFLSVAS